MIKTFNKLNYPIVFHLPNRLSEGYGLKKYGIDKLHEQGVTLIITVDNGIACVDEVEYCKSLGIDVITTDHHHCKPVIPDSVAVVCPTQEDCHYPFPKLAGCGVAFKLAQALIPDLLEHDDIDEFMNILALGSVADIVPLVDENRVFGALGIKNMGESSNLGLRTLIKESGIADKKISAGTISFQIAPRINAIGRLGEPMVGVDLLTTNDPDVAKSISQRLIAINEERQEIERRIVAECIDAIEADYTYELDKVLVVHGEGFHSGIMGIACSKICEKYNKPTILLSVEDGMCKGSARSIPTYSILDGLDYSHEHLSAWGGHDAAAGLSLEIASVPLLRKKINEHAHSVLTDEDMIPVVKYECEVSITDITFDLVNELSYLEPYGMGNPTPIFRLDNVQIHDFRTMGKDNSHMKLTIFKDGRVLDAIGFNMELPDWIERNIEIDLLFTIGVNEFRGNKSLQLLIKDFKKSIDN